MIKRFLIVVLSSSLLSLSIVNAAVANPVQKYISKNEAPFFLSIWSINKTDNSRSKYLCDAVIIDRYYAVGSATCLQKYDWPLVGVIGASIRGERGSVFPIWTWMWTSEHEEGSKNHDFALIYAPHGIAPWSNEYDQIMPKIGYPKASNLEMISWVKNKKNIDEYLLHSTPMKVVGNLPSKASKKARDNIFTATSIPTSSKKLPLVCNSSRGSPLIYRANGRVTLVGIVSSANEKCDASKPLKFIAVQKFKNFIEFNKPVLANDLLDDRRGAQLTPIYDSILSPKAKERIPAKIGDNGSLSTILTSDDPELIDADIWGLRFNIWKTGMYEVALWLKDELEGCALAKNSTVAIQISKNSEQNVDFAFEVKERNKCWVVGEVYTYVEAKSLKESSSLDCTVKLYPWGTDFSEDPLSKIRYLSFYFNPECLGFRDSIWIRAYLNNGPDPINTNIEPFYDGWFGPWKPTIF